jgi:phenylacetate-CoA ligase
MPDSSFDLRRQLERLDRQALRELQLRKLNRLLQTILPHNRFYAAKLEGCQTTLSDLAALQQWPLTTKQELHPPPGEGHRARNLSYDVGDYARYHRTSGTRGQPLVVLDTARDWQWWIDTWQFVLDAAEVTGADRVAMAFSFGPFIGFWSANDALIQRGALVMPCGGMSSLARLNLICDEQATIVCCTPSYALHLADIAVAEGLDLANSAVRALIVAGEPGGSVPAVRERSERVWQAKLIDHAGATEVGPWGYADRERVGLHVVESEFIAEFLRVEDQQPAEDDELAELVLTSLGRPGAPLLRYCTGDLVRADRRRAGDNRFVHLPGGVLGRVDDMMIVRGVNIYPSAIEQILRAFPEVQEYRLTVKKQGAMDALTIEVEDQLGQPERIARQLHVQLGLHVDVHDVPLGSLPRFELKGNRFIDARQ